MIVGMNWRVASERRAGELAAAVGDDFVDVHVELGAAARHPDVQGKHVVMLAGQDFVASLHDQFVALIIEPVTVVVGDRSCFLQDRIGGDHLARDQVLADTEVLEGPLGLRAPQLVGGNFNHAETISLFSHAGHFDLSWLGTWTSKAAEQDGCRLQRECALPENSIPNKTITGARARLSDGENRNSMGSPATCNRRSRARRGAWPQGMIARLKPPCSAETRLSRSNFPQKHGSRG